ncbi:MAG: addiction module protein [Planctomycetes bacterium]|nr:addiction module protein [Planctomycetota bacterium]
MGITLPLDKMTTAEKLAEMERLWDDLCRHPDDVPSPDWHEAVLAEREKLVTEGKMSFIDLDEAKERIRKATR